MTLPELLIDIGRVGVVLRSAYAALGFTPKSAMTAARALAFVLNRSAMLRLVRDGYAPADNEAAYTFAERIALAEELGMPTQTGSSAWMIAVGESMQSSCVSTTIVVHCQHGAATGQDSAGG